jgi:hypothetical protein
MDKARFRTSNEACQHINHCCNGGVNVRNIQSPSASAAKAKANASLFFDKGWSGGG